MRKGKKDKKEKRKKEEEKEKEKVQVVALFWEVSRHLPVRMKPLHINRFHPRVVRIRGTIPCSFGGVAAKDSRFKDWFFVQIQKEQVTFLVLAKLPSIRQVIGLLDVNTRVPCSEGVVGAGFNNTAAERQRW